MKTVQFFLTGMLFSGCIISAQQLSCGTPDLSFEQFQEMKSKAALFKSVSKKSITYIPVQIHLVGLDDNTGYVSNDNVNDALAELNRKYAAINVQFYFKGTAFKYYPNSALYNGNLTDAQTLAFCSANGSNNSMNLYAAYTVKLNGSNVGGWSYVAPTLQQYNATWVVNGQFNDDKTTPHEFGHYFGLAHTFNNSTSATINARELVTRNTNEVAPRLSANCDITGDYICDTESDPRGLTNATVTNCAYTGTAVDANNDTFHPLMQNYMDYNFCPSYSFTPGQYDRMLNMGLPIVTNAADFTMDAPETVQSAPSNLTVVAGDYTGQMQVSWTDNSTSETGYILEAKNIAGGDYFAVRGVKANSTSITSGRGLIGGQQYRFRIKPSNSKSTYSNESNVIVIPTMCANTNQNACTPYTTGSTAAGWNIDEVKIARGTATLMTNASSNCSTGSIGNFYNTHSALASQGDVLTVTVKNKVSSGGQAYTGYVKGYVDWNKDGIFDESAEKIMEGSGWSGITQNFTVPLSIGNGEYRLRVVSDAGGLGNVTSCSSVWGEIEDYKLRVGTLSTQDVLKDKIALYPNPVKNELHFSAKLNSIEIFSIDGKKNQQYNEGSSVNVMKLSKGVYILTAKDQNGNSITEKFIKE